MPRRQIWLHPEESHAQETDDERHQRAEQPVDHIVAGYAIDLDSSSRQQRRHAIREEQKADENEADCHNSPHHEVEDAPVPEDKTPRKGCLRLGEDAHESATQCIEMNAGDKVADGR